MESTAAGWVTVRGSADGFAQDVTARGHHLVGDEPEDAGGTDTGPTPYDLLLAALGCCTSMTVAFHARRRKWPLQFVTVRLRHSKVHAKDCADCDQKAEQIDVIERVIRLDGDDLTEEERAELLAIANRCPVSRTLSSPVRVETRFAASDE